MPFICSTCCRLYAGHNAVPLPTRLGLIPSVASTVATVTATFVTVVVATTLLFAFTGGASGGFVHGFGDNFVGEVEEGTKVFNAFVGQVVVVVAPIVSFLDETTRSQRFQQGHDFNVAHTGNVGVFGQGVVFFDDADTLFEEVGVGGNTFFSSDKP